MLGDVQALALLVGGDAQADEDIDELAEVGIPVVERLLGGTIIRDDRS